MKQRLAQHLRPRSTSGQKIKPDVIQTMVNKIKELNEKPLCELLEEVYEKFGMNYQK